MFLIIRYRQMNYTKTLKKLSFSIVNSFNIFNQFCLWDSRHHQHHFSFKMKIVPLSSTSSSTAMEGAMVADVKLAHQTRHGHLIMRCRRHCACLLPPSHKPITTTIPPRQCAHRHHYNVLHVLNATATIVMDAVGCALCAPPSWPLLHCCARSPLPPPLCLLCAPLLRSIPPCLARSSPLCIGRKKKGCVQFCIFIGYDDIHRIEFAI
jgi:hypothetical protein